MSHFQTPERAGEPEFPFGLETFSLEGEPAQRRIKKRLPDVRKGGEIIADGELVYKNGKWLK